MWKKCINGKCSFMGKKSGKTFARALFSHSLESINSEMEDINQCRSDKTLVETLKGISSENHDNFSTDTHHFFLSFASSLAFCPNPGNTHLRSCWCRCTYSIYQAPLLNALQCTAKVLHRKTEIFDEYMVVKLWSTYPSSTCLKYNFIVGSRKY